MEKEQMSVKEQEIARVFERVIPKLTEMEKEKLLSFGEGIAFAVERDRQRTA